MIINLDTFNLRVTEIEKSLELAKIDRVDELVKILPIKIGDYIKFRFSDDIHYMYIKNIEKHYDHISLEGPILRYYDTSKEKDKFVCFHFYSQFVIQPINVKDRLRDCEIITKEEFNNMFYEIFGEIAKYKDNSIGA